MPFKSTEIEYPWPFAMNTHFLYFKQKYLSASSNREAEQIFFVY